MNNNTVAIVVTYNRLKLLKKNISALLAQTEPIDILIINNASTDGTEEYIKDNPNERIKYINTGSNLGGAGGFAFGIKEAFNQGYDYAWVMDDDSIPSKMAYEELRKIVDLKYPFSFLASAVYWIDGRIFPMNRPTIERVCDEHTEAIKNSKVIPIQSCSFVGCFFPLKNVAEIGLPISDFFIYGDDVEYTRRMRKLGPAYWVMDSEIIHEAPSINGADVATASVDRLGRFYYQYRNGMYIARKYEFRDVLQQLNFVRKSCVGIIKSPEKHRLRRFGTVIKGTFSGLFYNPKIDIPTQKHM